MQGEGALIAALETARTGRLSDIVATIQAEQDDIIRAPMPIAPAAWLAQLMPSDWGCS